MQEIEEWKASRKRKRKPKYYQCPEGLIEINMGIALNGELRKINTIKYGHLVRPMLASPKDGKWKRIRGSSMWINQQRDAALKAVKSALKGLGYTKLYVHVVWREDGLCFKREVPESFDRVG